MIKHLETAPKQHHVCTLSKYLNSQEGRSRDNKYPQISSRIKLNIYNENYFPKVTIHDSSSQTYIFYLHCVR